MNWAEEVAAGERDVRADLADEYASKITDVRIIARDSFTDRPAWGAYEEQTRTIYLYKAAFDQMPDPENRERQIREVILHEFHHAFGHIHVQGGVVNSTWYGFEPITVEGPDGLWITLPDPR